MVVVRHRRMWPVPCRLLLVARAATRGKPSRRGTTGHVWDGDLRRVRTSRCRAGGSACSTSPSSSASAMSLWYPGMGKLPGHHRLVIARRTRADRPPQNAQAGRDTPSPSTGKRCGAGAGSAGAGSRPLRVQQQLRHLPWLRSAQGARAIPNLTDDDLALGRRARPILQTVTRWARRRDAGVGSVPGSLASKTSMTYTCTACRDRKRRRGRPWHCGARNCSPACARPAMASKARAIRCWARPTLTDAYWMYGSSRKAIRRDPRPRAGPGAMPAHRRPAGRNAQSVWLAAYVWSLVANKPAELAAVEAPRPPAAT